MTITDPIFRRRWIIEKRAPDCYRVIYQEYYSGSGWRTIGSPELYDRECVEHDFDIRLEA